MSADFKMAIRQDRQNSDNNTLTVYWPKGGFIRWYGDSVTRWIAWAKKKSKKTGMHWRKVLFAEVSTFG